MDCHLNAAGLGEGDDRSQKITEVGEQGVLVDVFVLVEQKLKRLQALLFPAGQHDPFGVLLHFGGHFFWRQVAQDPRVIGEHLRAVRQGLGQFGAGPVEHRHEVVADDVDAGLGQVLQRKDVVLDIAVARRQTQFDIFVDIDAFDGFQSEPGGLHLSFEGEYLVQRPDFADRHVEQSADDVVQSGDLPHILQRERFVLLAVPAEGHFHRFSPPRTLRPAACGRASGGI